MGLLDVLNGMQNGPRGQPQAATPGSGGMSKTTMALLAFLAYKAFKGMNPQQPAQAGAPSPGREPQEPGGLVGVLRTIFGGGSVPGPVLSRGVGNTVRDFEQSGQGEIARSWAGVVRTVRSQQTSWRQLLGRMGSEISCSRLGWSAMSCLRL